MSTVLKFVTQRLLKDNQWNRFGVEDPYYEYIPVNPNNPEITKKVKRPIPEGLSKYDTDVLSKFKRRAHRYDMWFSIYGIRFGWANIFGLIPAVGPLICIYWSYSLFRLALTLDDKLPLDIQILFIINVVLDFVLGLVPIVGDLIVLEYKANLRNCLVLEKHLYRVGQKNLGHIEAKDVRPGFINDKIQPALENKVYPAASKMGGEIKEFVDSHSGNSSGVIDNKPSTRHRTPISPESDVFSNGSSAGTPPSSNGSTTKG